MSVADGRAAFQRRRREAQEAAEPNYEEILAKGTTVDRGRVLFAAGKSRKARHALSTVDEVLDDFVNDDDGPDAA